MPLTLDHPYRDLRGGAWLRGNLHTHTTRSDGTGSPQEVIKRYADAGYDFLAITDHDKPAFARDHKEWGRQGLVLIAGNEITRNGPHLLHVNPRRKVEPVSPRQAAINDAQSAGGFIVVNHPNWGEDFNHCTREQMREWVDYVGMEIFNGTIHRLHGSPLATDKWDLLLKTGRPVWGFANDDYHGHGDFGLGWNVAYARSRTPAAIVEALEKGRFYASTGVRIERISVTKGVIRIEAPEARRIVAVGPVGKRRAEVDGGSMTFEPDDKMSYVRFECLGDADAMAWTQPFFIRA